jgi:ribonuclease HI
LLEPIEHFKFPPWSAKTPYSVEISQLPKQEAALAHNRNLLQNNQLIRIYTDASYIPNAIGIGVGLVVIDKSRPIYTEQVNIGLDQIVYNGELEGITRGIEYASNIAKPGQIFEVYSDNQASLLRLKNATDKPGQACLIRAIKATSSLIQKGAKISLFWVPGHTEIEGNELADLLAKEALELEPDSDEVSFAVLGQRIRENKALEWASLIRQDKSKYSKDFNPTKGLTRIRIPNTTKRELASAFYQLKLGHGYIKSYLYRFNISTNDRCRCGKRETPEHLLLDCPIYREPRNKLRSELGYKPSLPILLNTSLGIEKTLEFLKTTRIATRRWHLEREEEGAGDGEEEGAGDGEDEEA